MNRLYRFRELCWRRYVKEGASVRTVRRSIWATTAIIGLFVVTTLIFDEDDVLFAASVALLGLLGVALGVFLALGAPGDDGE